MKVLFWVKKFPSFSETFIRDQVVSLLDHGLDVVIYTKNGKINKNELNALNGFESYNLIDRIVDVDIYFEKNKYKRLFKLIPILYSAFFSKNFKYYKEALSFNKYGASAKALRLFFRVHFVLKYNINVIHAHFGPNGNEAAVLKRIGLPIKLFATFHGYDIRLGLTKGGHIYKTLFEQADGIFAISGYNYKNLLKFGVSETKLINLPNGINVAFFKRRSEISKLGVIKVLTVARLVKEKALDVAIKAINEVVQSKLNIILEYTIVGEGELREELQDLIDSLGLSKQIKLIGAKHSKAVRDFMVQSDLFLLSSEAEALPTVLLEAQAAEMVVLATNVGSVYDIVKSGLVVPSKDIEAFTNGLQQLLKKRREWPIMAAEGRKFVCKFHDIKQLTKKLITFYEL